MAKLVDGELYENGRIIATEREEHEMCEALTPGCCIDHHAEQRRARELGELDQGGCDTW